MAPYPPPSSRLYLLHLGALLLLAYLSPALCTCRKGTPDECMDAPFVPGHDLVGEGFDIVKMQRKRAYAIDVQTYLNADNTCQVCENDEMDDELQKLPLSVIDWRSNSKCSRSFTSAMYESATEFVQSTASQIKNDWKLGLGLEELGVGVGVGVGVEVGMGRSHVAKFAFSMAKQDHYTFAIHEFNCTYYTFRVSNTASLSREFAQDISRLPRDYNDKTRQRYKQLLNTYGTHYLAQVDLGGRMRTVSAIRTCLTILSGQTTSKIKDCLSAQLELTYGLFNAGPKVESCSSTLDSKDTTVTSFYKHMHQITEMVPGDVWVGSLSNDTTGFDIWFDQLKEDPGVVSYSLNPLPMLITDKVIKGHVKTAIQQYLQEKAISPDELPICKSGACCPKETHRAKLQIYLRATGLTGDWGWWEVSDAFATVKYGADSKTTEVKFSDDPVWKTLDFGNVYTVGSSMSVEVYDQDWWRNELLGTVHFSLTAGSHTETRSFGSSTVTLSYSLTCDAHLGGDLCSQYTP
ncbi:perforin-1-like [Sardina pilchardus]|uniref:perforin-1-like n=1 Tax=Sardina pilchardus TaxID=27697 RepID=UPI002E1442A5